MRKCAEYRAMAIAHARLAIRSRSDEVCEKHVRIAASFLMLAAEEAMRRGRDHLLTRTWALVEGQNRRSNDSGIVLH
jgi:hypothetical protein